MTDREELEAAYHDLAASLNLLADSRERHERTSPGCDAAPLCAGPQAAAGLVAVIHEHGTGVLSDMVLVAVGEIVRHRRIEAGLRKRLEAQRALACDHLQRIERAEDERKRALAKMDDTEHRLSAALAELTVWEEAADHLGPVGRPDIEP